MASASSSSSLGPDGCLGLRAGAIPIRRRQPTLEVEHLHQLAKGTLAPSSPVFTPISPVAIAVKFLQDSDDDNNSGSDSDNADSVMNLNLPSTPLRPALIYLGDNGKIQYTLGDAPPSRLCDLKWYADQLAAREQMVADLQAEKLLTEDVITDMEKVKISAAPATEVAAASSPSPYYPPSSTATLVPAPGDSSDAEVYLVGYGVAEIRLSSSSARQSWHVPATAYIEADGVTVDIHSDTPEEDRVRIIVSALRHAYNQLAPLMQNVESAIRASMPGYMGLSCLKVAPPPPARTMIRTHHLSAPVGSPLPDVGVPRLILVNTLANMYLLMYPAGVLTTSPDWVRFGGTLDLTSETLKEGTIFQHPLAPSIVKTSHDLFLRALRTVVGVSMAPPNAVVRAMMRADAVGEYQRHDEEDSDDYEYELDSDDDFDDGHLDFEVDPEMFGG